MRASSFDLPIWFIQFLIIFAASPRTTSNTLPRPGQREGAFSDDRKVDRRAVDAIEDVGEDSDGDR
jgi:hypothetical protein